MSNLVDQPWLAAQSDDFDPNERAATAEALWAKHHGGATHGAMVVALRVVEELAGGTAGNPVGVSPPPPPKEVFAPLGGEQSGEAVAQATWNLIGALALEAAMEVTDPFIKGQMQVISDQHRGAGVYMFTWWAHSGFQHIRSSRDANSVEVARLAITNRLARNQ